MPWLDSRRNRGDEWLPSNFYWLALGKKGRLAIHVPDQTPGERCDNRVPKIKFFPTPKFPRTRLEQQVLQPVALGQQQFAKTFGCVAQLLYLIAMVPLHRHWNT